MMYLKPLIKKIVPNIDGRNEIILQAERLSTDKDLLEYLSRIVEFDEIESIFSHYYGINLKTLKETEVDEDLIKRFNLTFLEKETIIPLSYDESSATYHFAISNLVDRNLRDKIKKIVNANNQEVVFYFVFDYEIKEFFSELKNEEKKKPLKKKKEENSDFNATQWVDNIINQGIDIGASDIHIERLKEEIQIRYRVDGILTHKEHYQFTESEVSNIYVRLKIVSNMDIVESRKSQDGRIGDYKRKDKFYDLRVNTVNTIYGEKFVMRIIRKDDKIAKFSDLGFTKENEEKIREMLANQNGIIYLAGATGSGKTTTLYSMIDALNEDSVNIYTIENPVEKTIDNVNQIQIDEASGTDYASVLSALLRQDPNIIVVGEVRDSDTADLSIRASLTGHLVITTIHANNALDSLSRLSDMGIEDYLIGASSIGFISQRLVRKLCPECKVKRETLKEHEEIWLKENNPDFDYEKEKAKGNYIYGPGNCDACTNGYKGRVALIEALLVDDNLRTMISKNEGINKMKEYSINNDYETLKTDGIKKALSGITSMEELMGQV